MSTRSNAWMLPPVGENPSTERQGTTPGSFANAAGVGTPYAFSSPDTPGMPGVSDLHGDGLSRRIARSRGQDAARRGARRRRSPTR